MPTRGRSHERHQRAVMSTMAESFNLPLKPGLSSVHDSEGDVPFVVFGTDHERRAAQVVRAVNNFDALLDAALLAENALIKGGGKDDATKDALAKLKAALDKA